MRCPLKERGVCDAMPRRGASLRAALARFLGKANGFRVKWLSAGATRHGEQYCGSARGAALGWTRGMRTQNVLFTAFPHGRAQNWTRELKVGILPRTLYHLHTTIVSQHRSPSVITVSTPAQARGALPAFYT